MLFRALLLALLSAGLSVGFADENDGMTRLRVQVTTLGGKPIDRASVVVRFVEGRSIAKLGKKMLKQWELRTNQEGWARFPSIPEGKVRIQVIAAHHQTFGDVFEVEGAEKSLTIKLNPPQPQHSEH